MIDIHTITSAKTTGWLCNAVQWIADKLMDLWHAHVRALNESEIYRRQLVILTGAAITLLAIAGPMDAFIAEAVVTYVAAYTRDARSNWSSRSTGTSPDFYGEDRW